MVEKKGNIAGQEGFFDFLKYKYRSLGSILEYITITSSSSILDDDDQSDVQLAQNDLRLVERSGGIVSRRDDDFRPRGQLQSGSSVVVLDRRRRELPLPAAVGQVRIPAAPALALGAGFGLDVAWAPLAAAGQLAGHQGGDAASTSGHHLFTLAGLVLLLLMKVDFFHDLGSHLDL